MSEIRKQSNLMAFGKISEDITQMEVGKDYGKLGASGSNRVRKSKIDVKTMSKISKKMQDHVKKENTNAAQTFSRVGGNATVLKHQLQKASGSASSVISFTPLQGLEIIVNSNNAAENDKEGIDREDGYFSSLAQFNKRDAKDFTI
ncbi:MAG: U4/U6 small nuclear ribonucleoprotein Prp31 [Marteilia pararefringens]